MNRIALLTILLAMAARNEGHAETLTFDQAAALAAARSASATADPALLPEIRELRRSRLPSVRAEVSGNSSRSLDLFSEGPYEVRFATSVLAFDYPLWDGGVTSARLAAVEEKVRRAAAARGRLDDSRFAQLLEAFGELYLVQKQQELVRPFYEQLAAEADRSEALVTSGEISNLTATERRELALSFASRLLDLEARRIDAAGKLRHFTGLEPEPTLVIDLAQPGTGAPTGEHASDDVVHAATIAVEESRARLRELHAANGFRAMLSGFVGIGAAESEFSSISSYGSFGVYALRVHLSYPLFGGVSKLPVVEARIDLERSLAARDAAIDAARTRAAEYELRAQTSRRRIVLMQESVERSKEREESLNRLVLAGVRPEADLVYARAERSRRETDLLAAEIEQWKAGRLLMRMMESKEPQADEADQP